ncbi:MAG: ACP S-malonyltransferase [Parachlamydiaceae bacterium]|nr:ACP S-malonyltransferase [Parachlamydiaceae bacterium]
MTHYKKIAFIFPGQGAQYVGMGKDFVDNFPIARETFAEADDILGRKLSKIILEGPEALLTETKNSQVGIFVNSVAILRVLQTLIPGLSPHFCAGLSLGEYTALFASQRISFADDLKLVQYRGQCMNDACETTQGTMAVVLGLDADAVEKAVKEVNLPNDLWAANFNCPGQVVISGTTKGIQAGTTALQAKGAKRVLPLQVHGAFHSGLMHSAEVRLAEQINHVSLKDSAIALIMNVTGKSASSTEEIRHNLIKQVTSPVRWEQCVRHIADQGADLFIEIGCAKTLAGFNKRIGVTAPTVSVDKIQDLEALEQTLSQGAPK